MKRVRILVPFDGHMPGDEAEFSGRLARQYIAEKKAADLRAPAKKARPRAPAKKARA